LIFINKLMLSIKIDISFIKNFIFCIIE